MINAPAPIAPELAYKEEQHSKERQRELRIAKVIMSYWDFSLHLLKSGAGEGRSAYPPFDMSGLTNIYFK